MTKTEHLGLCRWVPEDPVSLSEMNDNFSRLDENGGRAVRLAERGLVTLGGALAVQAHNGGRPAFAEGMIVDAFQDASLLDTYSGGLLFLNRRLEVAPACPASATVAFNGEKEFHASVISGEIVTEKAWAELFTFRPDGYCAVTKLTLKTASSTSTGTPAHMKLSIWRGSSKLCETEMGVINHYSDATESAAAYTLNQALDPNYTYTMKLWIEDKTTHSALLSYVKFDVTPSSYSTGTATCSGITLPAETKRAEILVHATAAAPTVSIRFAGSGSFTALTAKQTADETLPGGTACKLRRYTADVPAGAASAQVRLSVSGSCIVYDYALILL